MVLKIVTGSAKEFFRPISTLISLNIIFSTVENQFSILVGGGMLRFLAWHKKRLPSAAWFSTVAAIVVGLFLLSIISFRQTRIWHDNSSYWNHILKIDPSNYLVYNNRGVFLKEQKGNRDYQMLHWFAPVLHPFWRT